MDRLSWQDYFVNIVNATSQRSTCNRGKPGCIFVKNNQVLVTGYAGSPPKFPHCDEVGHEMEARCRIAANPNYPEEMKMKVQDALASGNVSFHCVRTIHAEQNAIIQAAKRGVALEGSTCYVTMTPCRTCAMMLVGLGIKDVIAIKKYQKAKESMEFFKIAGIDIIHLDEQELIYG